MDDIIVGGRDAAEHDAILKKVLDRARKINLRQNPKVSSQPSLIGGLKADPTKPEARLTTNPPSQF